MRYKNIYFIISLRLKNIFPPKEGIQCDNYIQANYLWIDDLIKILCDNISIFSQNIKWPE